MSDWDEYNKKMCVDFIADENCCLFSVSKKEHHRFLNGFSWTQLKDCMGHRHEKR